MYGKSFIGIRACTWVYLALMSFTFATFLMAQYGMSGLHFSFYALGLGLLKGHLIGDYFMGLRRLRGFWRWPILIWLLLLGGLIGTAFYLSV